MTENVKVRWLTDHEQTKVVPKTLSSQVYNEDGTVYKDTVDAALQNKADKADIVQSNWNQNDETALDYVQNRTHWIEDDGETYHPLDEKFIPDTIASKDYVDSLVKKLNATLALGFYCIEEVTVIVNGVSTVYPANSNVEMVLADEDVFEIVPTSNNSILSLSAYPGALGTFYPWLDGVKQFSNILFNMNNEDMYSKWSQGNQGSYQVQFAQYSNCIFWSDNPYISDVTRRTNYTLCSTTQLPLCYSTIPENTFKSFYLAFNVNSDPNWSNPLYKDSFANANWATQAFSYYGARIVGFPGHDSPNFNIILPKDCRGLMFDARNIECAGTFDAINCTNFGAKSGSWREAFGDCPSLRRLYIKNLKVNLNISWSPVDYDSIYFIISKAANTNAIKISVSPYTYNLLKTSDFELAASKNITIELITTNYDEDLRLGAIENKADKVDVYTKEEVYTKTETDTLLEAKVNVEEPRMSGSMGLNQTGELGWAAVSLGFANEASGMYSFSEGMGNHSTGDSSHSEGTGNTASGSAAHVEGYGTQATNTGAHAEGAYTKATGFGSHAEGSYTIASGEGQHAEGKYNLEDSTAIHVVGNGTAEASRSNAHTLGLNGEAWFSGDVYVGSTSGTHKDEGSKKLVTEEYVDNKVAGLVDSAPELLNTLDELANALGDDPNFATTVLNQISEIEGKVDEMPQSNWEQNDETAKDYIIGRTHWKEEVPTITLLDNETTILWPYDHDWVPSVLQEIRQGDSTPWIERPTPEGMIVEEGMTLTVAFNGQTYTGELKLAHGPYTVSLYIGNLELAKYVDTGLTYEPPVVEGEDYCFGFSVVNESTFELVGCFPCGTFENYENEYLISATLGGNVYHKLDENFIPMTAITSARIAEICGLDLDMTLIVDENGDAITAIGLETDANGNAQV